MNDAEYFRSAAGSASSMAGIMEMSIKLGVFRAVRVKNVCGARDIYKTLVWN